MVHLRNNEESLDLHKVQVELIFEELMLQGKLEWW